MDTDSFFNSSVGQKQRRLLVYVAAYVAVGDVD